MNESMYISEIINTMYEDIFFVFFRRERNRASQLVENHLRYRGSNYYPYKCPAKYIVIKALTSIQIILEAGFSSWDKAIEHKAEYMKTVRSYLSKSNLFEFKKLNQMYAEIRENNAPLSEQNINIYKEAILKIINPQYILSLYLYMKYHKIYNDELFRAFCEMIGLNHSPVSESITTFCLTVTDRTDELFAEVKERPYDKNGRISSKVYEWIYEDIQKVIKEYPSFEAYKQTKDELEEIAKRVLKEAKVKKHWNPKRSKSGNAYPSTIDKYEKTLKTLIKSEVLTPITSTSKNYGNEPNLRTIRDHSPQLARDFRLETPPDNKEDDTNKIKTCPKFLCGELWECLQKQGLRGQSEKTEKRI